MFKKRVTAMKITPETYKEIMSRESYGPLTNAKFRSMLVSLKTGCCVETLDERGGSVIEIERDQYDIPVRVKTKCDVIDRDARKKIDEYVEWIDVMDILSWEAWDFIAPEYLFEDSNTVIGELMFESEVT